MARESQWIAVHATALNRGTGEEPRDRYQAPPRLRQSGHTLDYWMGTSRECRPSTHGCWASVIQNGPFHQKGGEIS